MISIFKKLFDTEYKELKKFNAIAEKIDELDEEYSKLSDKKLAGKTAEFKKRLDEGETLEDVLVETFATIREAAYRNNGTMVLGTAEGGLKITLYMINSLQLDPDYLNQYYFHTMHHEFAHILHQTKPYSSDFEMISGTDYVKDTWNDAFKSDADAQQHGFITPYAASEANEDFVELLSTYITNTPKFWSDMLKTAGKDGSAIIEQKFDIVYNYMKNTWGIDLNDLRDVILKRQGEIDQLDLDNL